MTQRQHLRELLGLFCLLSILGLGCGQRRNLRTVSTYPEIQRLVTIPTGFEVWFKPTNAYSRIVVWVEGEHGLSTPQSVQAQLPVNIERTSVNTQIRAAYGLKDGVGPISPNIVLQSTQPPPMPKVTCELKDDVLQLNVHWSNHNPDLSRRLFVRAAGELRGILSSNLTMLPVSPKVRQVELVYEDRDFRSAKWRVSCPLNEDG